MKPSNSNLDCSSLSEVKTKMVTLGTASMVNREETSDKEKRKQFKHTFLESRSIRDDITRSSFVGAMEI